MCCFKEFIRKSSWVCVFVQSERSRTEGKHKWKNLKIYFYFVFIDDNSNLIHGAPYHDSEKYTSYHT